MRRAVAGARPDLAVYRRARRPCPRCGTPIASRGLGDRNRTAYWCPRCQVPGPPGERASERGFALASAYRRAMAVRAPQLHHALRGFVLGAFAYLLRELEDEGDSLPFAFEEHGGRGRPGALRVPAARARLRRGASRPASRPGGCDDRARRARPRARGRHLRARARRRRPVRGRRALPYRPRRPPDSRRGGVRRFRLGRHVVRPRLRRARALAVRRAPHLRRRRAARRHHDRDPAGARRRRPCPGRRRRRARSPLAGGERPAAERLRARAGSVLRDRAALRARQRRGRAGRACRDRRRRFGDPSRDGSAARRGPRALRDARRPPLRDPAGASHRGDAASRRADPARRVSRAARRRAPRPARARRCRHEPRGGARPLGAVALPARAVPLGAASLGARGAPRRHLAAPRVRAARGGARTA